MDRKYDVITLGEILLRLSTPINGRLAQGDTLMRHLGGAELNIASINKIDISDVPKTMFYNTRLFHTSGIALGLGGKAQDFAIQCIKEFKANGTLISFDVNYRANLWSGEDARKCIEAILPYVDIFFCSEDMARLTFGKTGTIEEIQKSFCEEYPISVVASTERTVITPKKHNFTSIIYSAQKDAYYREAPYNSIDEINSIIAQHQDTSEFQMEMNR